MKKNNRNRKTSNRNKVDLKPAYPQGLTDGLRAYAGYKKAIGEVDSKQYKEVMDSLRTMDDSISAICELIKALREDDDGIVRIDN